ncbi:nucleotidyltransferase family related, partial [Cystoisospora suis]
MQQPRPDTRGLECLTDAFILDIGPDGGRSRQRLRVFRFLRGLIIETFREWRRSAYVKASAPISATPSSSSLSSSCALPIQEVPVDGPPALTSASDCSTPPNRVKTGTSYKDSLLGATKQQRHQEESEKNLNEKGRSCVKQKNGEGAPGVSGKSVHGEGGSGGLETAPEAEGEETSRRKRQGSSQESNSSEREEEQDVATPLVSSSSSHLPPKDQDFSSGCGSSHSSSCPCEGRRKGTRVSVNEEEQTQDGRRRVSSSSSSSSLFSPSSSSRGTLVAEQLQGHPSRERSPSETRSKCVCSSSPLSTDRDAGLDTTVSSRTSGPSGQVDVKPKGKWGEGGQPPERGGGGDQAGRPMRIEEDEKKRRREDNTSDSIDDVPTPPVIRGSMTEDLEKVDSSSSSSSPSSPEYDPDQDDVCIAVYRYGSFPLRTFLPDGDLDVGVISFNRYTGILEGEEESDALLGLLLERFQRDDVKNHAHFPLRQASLVDAEVRILKCTVGGIAVDVSVNKVGGCCSLVFLELADRRIGGNHLFKRSVLLIKSWFAYESHLLGSRSGLLATYCIETLVLHLFHVFPPSFLSTPLHFLFHFFSYFSSFHWDKYAVTSCGALPLTFITRAASSSSSSSSTTPATSHLEEKSSRRSHYGGTRTPPHSRGPRHTSSSFYGHNTSVVISHHNRNSSPVQHHHHLYQQQNSFYPSYGVQTPHSHHQSSYPRSISHNQHKHTAGGTSHSQHPHTNEQHPIQQHQPQQNSSSSSSLLRTQMKASSTLPPPSSSSSSSGFVHSPALSEPFPSSSASAVTAAGKGSLTHSDPRRPAQHLPLPLPPSSSSSSSSSSTTSSSSSKTVQSPQKGLGVSGSQTSSNSKGSGGGLGAGGRTRTQTSPPCSPRSSNGGGGPAGGEDLAHLSSSSYAYQGQQHHKKHSSHHYPSMTSPTTATTTTTGNNTSGAYFSTTDFPSLSSSVSQAITSSASSPSAAASSSSSSSSSSSHPTRGGLLLPSPSVQQSSSSSAPSHLSSARPPRDSKETPSTGGLGGGSGRGENSTSHNPNRSTPLSYHSQQQQPHHNPPHAVQNSSSTMSMSLHSSYQSHHHPNTGIGGGGGVTPMKPSSSSPPRMDDPMATQTRGGQFMGEHWVGVDYEEGRTYYSRGVFPLHNSHPNRPFHGDVAMAGDGMNYRNTMNFLGEEDLKLERAAALMLLMHLQQSALVISMLPPHPTPQQPPHHLLHHQPAHRQHRAAALVSAAAAGGGGVDPIGGLHGVSTGMGGVVPAAAGIANGRGGGSSQNIMNLADARGRGGEKDVLVHITQGPSVNMARMMESVEFVEECRYRFRHSYGTFGVGANAQRSAAAARAAAAAARGERGGATSSMTSGSSPHASTDQNSTTPSSLLQRSSPLPTAAAAVRSPSPNALPSHHHSTGERGIAGGGGGKGPWGGGRRSVFLFRSMNVVDPLHNGNNLARSVSETAFYRLLHAMKKGLHALTGIIASGDAHRFRSSFFPNSYNLLERMNSPYIAYPSLRPLIRFPLPPSPTTSSSSSSSSSLTPPYLLPSNETGGSRLLLPLMVSHPSFSSSSSSSSHPTIATATPPSSSSMLLPHRVPHPLPPSSSSPPPGQQRHSAVGTPGGDRASVDTGAASLAASHQRKDKTKTHRTTASSVVNSRGEATTTLSSSSMKSNAGNHVNKMGGEDAIRSPEGVSCRCTCHKKKCKSKKIGEERREEEILGRDSSVGRCGGEEENLHAEDEKEQKKKKEENKGSDGQERESREKKALYQEKEKRETTKKPKDVPSGVETVEVVDASSKKPGCYDDDKKEIIAQEKEKIEERSVWSSHDSKAGRKWSEGKEVQGEEEGREKRIAEGEEEEKVAGCMTAGRAWGSRIPTGKEVDDDHDDEGNGCLVNRKGSEEKKKGGGEDKRTHRTTCKEDGRLYDSSPSLSSHEKAISPSSSPREHEDLCCACHNGNACRKNNSKGQASSRREEGGEQGMNNRKVFEEKGREVAGDGEEVTLIHQKNELFSKDKNDPLGKSSVNHSSRSHRVSVWNRRSDSEEETGRQGVEGGDEELLMKTKKEGLDEGEAEEENKKKDVVKRRTGLHEKDSRELLSSPPPLSSICGSSTCSYSNSLGSSRRESDDDEDDEDSENADKEREGLRCSSEWSEEEEEKDEEEEEEAFSFHDALIEDEKLEDPLALGELEVASLLDLCQLLRQPNTPQYFNNSFNPPCLLLSSSYASHRSLPFSSSSHHPSSTAGRGAPAAAGGGEDHGLSSTQTPYNMMMQRGNSMVVESPHHSKDGGGNYQVLHRQDNLVSEATRLCETGENTPMTYSSDKTRRTSGNLEGGGEGFAHERSDLVHAKKITELDGGEGRAMEEGEGETAAAAAAASEGRGSQGGMPRCLDDRFCIGPGGGGEFDVDFNILRQRRLEQISDDDIQQHFSKKETKKVCLYEEEKSRTGSPLSSSTLDIKADKGKEEERETPSDRKTSKGGDLPSNDDPGAVTNKEEDHTSKDQPSPYIRRRRHSHGEPCSSCSRKSPGETSAHHSEGEGGDDSEDLSKCTDSSHLFKRRGSCCTKTHRRGSLHDVPKHTSDTGLPSNTGENEKNGGGLNGTLESYGSFFSPGLTPAAGAAGSPGGGGGAGTIPFSLGDLVYQGNPPILAGGGGASLVATTVGGTPPGIPIGGGPGEYYRHPPPAYIPGVGGRRPSSSALAQGGMCYGASPAVPSPKMVSSASSMSPLSSCSSHHPFSSLHSNHATPTSQNNTSGVMTPLSNTPANSSRGGGFSFFFPGGHMASASPPSLPTTALNSNQPHLPSPLCGGGGGGGHSASNTAQPHQVQQQAAWHGMTNSPNPAGVTITGGGGVGVGGDYHHHSSSSHHTSHPNHINNRRHYPTGNGGGGVGPTGGFLYGVNTGSTSTTALHHHHHQHYGGGGDYLGGGGGGMSSSRNLMQAHAAATTAGGAGYHPPHQHYLQHYHPPPHQRSSRRSSSSSCRSTVFVPGVPGGGDDYTSTSSRGGGRGWGAGGGGRRWNAASHTTHATTGTTARSL